MKRAALVIGLVLVAGTVLTALLSLAWTPYDPLAVVPANRLMGPGPGHWLGTDGYGIDLLSRIMVGARIAVLVGVVAVAIAALVGVPLGILAGTAAKAERWPRLVADVVMRGNDILYAFPAMLLAILLAAVLGGSTATAMIAIGVANIPPFLRVARAATLQVSVSDFVTAARGAGIGRFGIAVRHVLPNIAPVVAVQASLAFGMSILSEAALSYLGLSTPLPTPTWGRMLNEAQPYAWSDPLLAVWPGLAIGLAVLGFNLLGDGLRDLLDPRLRESVQ
ncbi:peptide/nickel transport system permease protein [Raineyella antarctica]|uniref:Peptide/nickel transport system permease protein n=1 Tax=Raineyella antarctica TaxID=1577474 RepID=A0A1G6GXG8_9ACTN|nr:ABC transporter permease [Raineyella antarctica]SDB85826.1 peptide/nickel transport system permease protein [Raineyella antarctica]